MRRFVSLRVVVAVAGTFAALASGCQTSRSWEQGCPGIYSGVRYFASQYGEVPFDGKVFFALDLPLSALADTLLLPASSFADRSKPIGGWAPGCRWAQ